jgi:hypothetical protein
MGITGRIFLDGGRAAGGPRYLMISFGSGDAT